MTEVNLAALRLFADMRQARVKLIGLDTPNAAERARLIRRPDIYKALVDLLFAAEKLVAAPDETALFWHPTREAYGAAEKRFEELARGAGGSTIPRDTVDQGTGGASHLSTATRQK